MKKELLEINEMVKGDENMIMSLPNFVDIERNDK